MKTLTTTMFTAAAVACVLAATTGPAAAIVGGQQAPHTYPGMGSMNITYPGLGVDQCDAGLISANYALTAAHCVSDFTVAPVVAPVDAGQITVRFGTTSRSTGGQVATGKKVLPHPDWAWLTATGLDASDLALVELDRPLHGPYLPVADWSSAHRRGPALLIGWGLTAFPVPPGSPLPDQLHQRDGVQLPAKACTGGGITGGEICVSKGTCFGDSGGPALIRTAARHGRSRGWLSIGIAGRETSEINPCGAPVIYTDPGAFSEWIAETETTGTTAPNRHTAPTTLAAQAAEQAAAPGQSTFLMTTSR
jgi:secreted trypsin-like serine protease